MSFPPLTPRTVRWRPVGAVGLEHLSLFPDGDRIVADGVVIGDRGGVPYGARYRIVCDAAWKVMSLDIHATDGRSLRIRSDGQDGWMDAEGWPLAAFDDCIDVDLAASPLTNTLPIRRLALSPSDAPAELKMLYIPFDTLAPVVDRQRYRCLDEDKLYRYEAVDRSFAADLPVDQDGLVINYPTLFERVFD